MEGLFVYHVQNSPVVKYPLPSLQTSSIMASWTYMIRFEATDGKIYFSALDQPQVPNSSIIGFSSFENLTLRSGGESVTLSRVRRSILPRHGLANRV
jgi:hypothetical protein